MLYCLVENNVVIQGPQQLPFSFGNQTGFNLVANPQDYSWYPYSDPGMPSYNGSIQSVTRSFTIDNTAKTVTQAYAIAALPPEQIQSNRQGVVQQSFDAKLQRQAASANAKGDTQTAVEYLLKQRSFP